MPPACDTDIDDIEDLVNGMYLDNADSGSYFLPDSRHDRELPAMVPQKAKLIASSRIREKTRQQKFALSEEVVGDVPGTQKIYVKTYGCSHNMSDSEYMMGQLAAYGYSFTEDAEEADVCLINSCTVKNPSQDSFIGMVERAKLKDKPVVVAGCVPQGDRNLKGLEDVSIIGVQQIDRVVEVVEETLKGNKVRLLSKNRLPRLDLPKIRKNPLVEIIPISTGCLGSCTYCKTRHARGKLGSYEVQTIVDRAKQAAQDGVKEVWLTSEDTGAYGRDIETDLPALLRAILEVLPPDVMLRVGMTNPPFILEHLEAIADILNHPQVFAFLHIPVQSGSNDVLLKMNREYTREEFCQVADFLKAHVPDVCVATDIICGFPTETNEDFEETLSLVRQYKFSVMNISQFYPRPGTPAAKMKRVDTKEVKRRSTELTKLFESYSCYDDMKGRVEKVWITEHEDAEHTVGHTKSYVKVLIPRDDNLLGKSTFVKIVDTAKWHVVGEIVKPDSTCNSAPSKCQCSSKKGEQGSEPLASELQNPSLMANWKLVVSGAAVALASMLIYSSGPQ
eukprot:GILK01005798.1.p1 GENE.GILK01005798.1~~GILK01005798.1.p1  ORF type:complete len:585 (+),score=92.25 GILK01005798.1:72-1757(+)